ncbi:MAG TPA: zf-HC2 domain-containing protein, partial [Polyangia bacterium]|nr:zf-HC2 domain-containing protein [Polyangia bacterium]
MTLSHEDANARLLDLVYGEAAPDERAALEAHVATCPRCTAELASLGGTRARVRAALDEDAPVPPRVRANLLAAAREAVAAVPA